MIITNFKTHSNEMLMFHEELLILNVWVILIKNQQLFY